MAYSSFKTLHKAKTELGLVLQEKRNLFREVPELAASERLQETLEENVPLALASNSEKARSELIIAPVLLEVWRRLDGRFSFFSGIEFKIDPARGLGGYCDFILSSDSERLFIAAPAFMLVEAKNESLKGGLGQCVAEMYAAQIFNERQGVEREYIYGTVTSGTNWQFLRLKGNIVEIDLSEYYLVQIDKILGLIALTVS